MMSKNQEILALAFRKAKAKNEKIKEYDINADMSAEDTEQLVIKLAKLKNPNEWTAEVKGQTWYVKDLQEFSKLTAAERLNHQYEIEFPSIASEAELLAKLEASM